MNKTNLMFDVRELLTGVRVLVKTVMAFNDQLQRLLAQGILEIFPQRHWLNIPQACDYLCCSKASLRNYRNKGLIHPSKVEGKCYFLESDLIAFIESGYSGAQMPLSFSNTDR